VEWVGVRLMRCASNEDFRFLIRRQLARRLSAHRPHNLENAALTLTPAIPTNI
ncbi:MAG: hypothetical protein RI953_1718, partial [Pseudomonadota bacterium]|jgi:hypothetical protein